MIVGTTLKRYGHQTISVFNSVKANKGGTLGRVHGQSGPRGVGCVAFDKNLIDMAATHRVFDGTTPREDWRLLILRKDWTQASAVLNSHNSGGMRPAQLP